MVLRVPDFKGKLHPKGRVIVPCHTTFDKRKNILTEVVHTDDKSKLELHQVISKISNSNASNYFPPENITDNENELWNRQLNRWWGWNWQRKRKECMEKFGHQFGDFLDYNFSKQEENVCFERCPCQVIYNKSTKEMNKQFLNAIVTLESDNHQKPIKDTHGFNKVYRGRLKRNKHNNHYEGLLPELSSNTDNSINKHKTHYLHLRLMNMHSNISMGKKRSEEKHKNNTENDICKSDSGVTYLKNEESYRNISVETNSNELSAGKTDIVNDCSKSVPCRNSPLSRISPVASSRNTSTEHAITEDLNSTISKGTIVSNEKADWQNNYNKLKEEHNELLTAVCEILCSKNSDSSKDLCMKHNCVCCGKAMTQNTENHDEKENSKFKLVDE